jgi:hypothetical protein
MFMINRSPFIVDLRCKNHLRIYSGVLGISGDSTETLEIPIKVSDYR